MVSPAAAAEKWIAFGDDFGTNADSPAAAEAPAAVDATGTAPIASIASIAPTAQTVRVPFDSTPAAASSAPLPPLIDPFDAFAPAAPAAPAATPSPNAESDPGDELAAALGLLDANLAREPRRITGAPAFGVGGLL